MINGCNPESEAEIKVDPDVGFYLHMHDAWKHGISPNEFRRAMTEDVSMMGYIDSLTRTKQRHYAAVRAAMVKAMRGI